LNPLGHPRPVTGLLYLLVYVLEIRSFIQTGEKILRVSVKELWSKMLERNYDSENEKGKFT
jgi:hypothetical protein